MHTDTDITSPRRGRPPQLHPDESVARRDRKRAKWRKYYHSLSPLDAWMRAALNNSKRRAARRGARNTLTIDDVRNMIHDDMLCAVLRLPLDIRADKRGCNDNSATIDRIDNNGDYTPENCHVVCMLLNRGKSQLSIEQLVKLGAWASEQAV